MKPSGPNLLDEPLKDFIVIPADLPRKGVKRLATSGERVNHDSWVKMCNLCKGLKKLVYWPSSLSGAALGILATTMMILVC